jgi:hypothetical protein
MGQTEDSGVLQGKGDLEDQDLHQDLDIWDPT